MKTIILTVALVASLSGCATFPKTSEAEAGFYADKAEAAIAKGEAYAAGFNTDVALTKPTGVVKVKELMTRYPKGRDYYREYLGVEIEQMHFVYHPIQLIKKLQMVSSNSILPPDQVTSLRHKLDAAVADANQTGKIPFDFDDNISPFPELKTAKHQAIILDRALKILQSDARNRPIASLVAYVERVGPTSMEGKRIEALLPSINIKRTELDMVAKVYPAFASARKEAITTRILLKIKNGDRLFADDIQQALRSQLRGIDWVTETGPKVTILGIERVRNEERIFPERTQTITYADYQVNLISAALLMPQNASYLYEIVSGGAEIEYGYVVDSVLDDKTGYEYVIRGKVGGEYQRCQNARIQNVFGGVNPATFVANDDQRRRCSGSSSTSIDHLRNEVLSKVVEGVREVPIIKAAEHLN